MALSAAVNAGGAAATAGGAAAGARAAAAVAAAAAAATAATATTVATTIAAVAAVAAVAAATAAAVATGVTVTQQRDDKVAVPQNTTTSGMIIQCPNVKDPKEHKGQAAVDFLGEGVYLSAEQAKANQALATFCQYKGKCTNCGKMGHKASKCHSQTNKNDKVPNDNGKNPNENKPK